MRDNRVGRTLVLGAFSAMACVSTVQANTLEEFLRSPAFKGILQRQAEIPNMLKQCQDARFRAANAQQCQSAEMADRVNRAPPELRSVLASDRGTASLRELCIAVPAATANANYLCAEYVKLDSAFRAQLNAAPTGLSGADRP
jgi:hypothetical protein